MKAYLTALLLFLGTVIAGHFYMGGKVAANNPSFSTWSSETKSTSLAGLTENMNEGSIPVFGSSEFQHGIDTIYHPASVFAGNRFNPMLIGAGYYQSLSHAITLAAISDSLQQRKAVLILSPQWFRKSGVVDQAYASRFSEILYTAMLENEQLSDETKDYMTARTEQLLSADEKTLDRVQLHNTVLREKNGTLMENGLETLWDLFLGEKDRFGIAAAQMTGGIQMGSGICEQDESPDWDALLAQAEADGEVENTNLFYINDTAYKKLEPYLAAKKDMNANAVNGYQNSPEYEDLRCFLQVCSELEIEPMLVLLPVNGYYYDYTGFPASARQGYYEKIRTLAAEFDAEVADFSDQEYTKYFFEDRVHLGKKGWVLVNESLYEFYLKD
jgi:D-alanine transfer protein